MGFVEDTLRDIQAEQARQGKKQANDGAILIRVEAQVNKTNGRVTALESKNTRSGFGIKITWDRIMFVLSSIAIVIAYVIQNIR